MALVNRRNVERLVVVAIALAICAVFVGEPKRIEYSLVNFRFSVNRGSAGDGLAERVVVVLADTHSEARLGRPVDSSWREFYPELISILEAAGARAVLWDAAFAASEPDYDAALAESLRGQLPVVAGEDPASSTVATLDDAFWMKGWLPLGGADSIPRTIPASDNPPPLSWIGAQLLLGADPRDGEPPVTETWIDYSRDIQEIASFSMADVLLSDGSRLSNDLRTPVSVFRDRIVFIGQSLPATDRYALPGTRGTRVPGVYSQVVASLTLAQSRQITRVAAGIDWLVSAIIAIILTAVWTLSQRWPRRISTLVVVLAGLLAPLVLFAVWRVWISYSAVIVAVIIPLLGVGVTRRMWLTRSYRTSLGFDPELIERHHESIESYAAGVEREAVVLCSDVRNYTQFVTDHPPDQVQRVMTDYMAAMERVVDQFGGYVNKYVGDEIVAVFGFPRDEKNTVDRSVRAALTMLDRLQSLKESWSAAGLPSLDAIGIGLDWGSLRFTHIGGRNRVQFDIIGNPINGASRLQVLTKEHKRAMILPAELVEVQTELDVLMYNQKQTGHDGPAVTFLGEVLVRGQGRRRVYGLV